jgi:hypothetical protein
LGTLGTLFQALQFHTQDFQTLSTECTIVCIVVYKSKIWQFYSYVNMHTSIFVIMIDLDCCNN